MVIRIVHIDDHPMVLKGIEQLLQLNADFEVVATCGTAAEGLAAVRRPAPTCSCSISRCQARTG